MASGLVDSLLEGVLSLAQMDRQRKKDEQDAAQQAVDNELRRYQLKQKDERQAQLDEYYDKMAQIRTDNSERLKLKDEEIARSKADNLALQTSVNTRKGQEAKRDDFTKRFDSPTSGASRREAMRSAGYTPEEIQQELASIVSDRTPGAMQSRASSDKANAQNVVAPAIAQIMAAMMGAPGVGPKIGGGTAMEGMPTAESVGAEQSDAFKQGSALRTAQEKLRIAQTERTAATTAQLMAMGEYEQQYKIAQTEATNAQALLSSARYKEIFEKQKLDREKFNFDKIIQNGRLNLAWADHEIRVLAEGRLQQNQNENNTRRSAVEKILTTAKKDTNEIYIKARNAADQAQRTMDAAKDTKARLKYPTIMGTGSLEEINVTQSLLTAEKQLAQFTPQYIAELRRREHEAEASRNEINRKLLAIDNVYSTVVTDRGTPDKSATANLLGGRPLGPPPADTRARLDESQRRNGLRPAKVIPPKSFTTKGGVTFTPTGR